MSRTLTSLSLLLVLLLLPGCLGTLLVLGIEPAADDDDDITGDDDDDVTADDDDSTPPDDDDDVTGDDDDDSVPGECAPDWALDCGQGAADSYNNGADGSTNSVLTYSCLDNAEWTGPEYTYSYVVETTGTHTVRLTGFQDDLDLMVLGAPDGACRGENCIALSGNPPGDEESLTFDGQQGRTVYIVVEGYNGTVSDFDLRLECPGGGDDDDDDDDDSTPPPIACTSLVVKAHQASDVQVWTWGANGYTGPTTQDPPGNGTVWGAVAGDFNGDGAMDFITERQGQGGLSAQLFAGACGSDQFTITNVTADNRGFTFSNLEDLHGAGDLDGDGDLDVLGINYNDGAGRVWLNGGDGLTWTAVPNAFALGSWDPSDTGTRESVGFPASDLTGDGVPDLLECTNAASGDTSCTVHTGSGTGTFMGGATFTLARLANSVVGADFNGDGAVDYLGGLDDDGDAGQVWMWLGSPFGPDTLPSGEGVPAFDVVADSSGGGDQDQPGYGWMFPADVDDDGDLDVIIEVLSPFGSLNQALHLATNDGSGGFVVTSLGTSTSSWTGGDELTQSSVGVPVRP